MKEQLTVPSPLLPAAPAAAQPADFEALQPFGNAWSADRLLSEGPAPAAPPVVGAMDSLRALFARFMGEAPDSVMPGLGRVGSSPLAAAPKRVGPSELMAADAKDPFDPRSPAVAELAEGRDEGWTGAQRPGSMTVGYQSTRLGLDGAAGELQASRSNRVEAQVVGPNAGLGLSTSQLSEGEGSAASARVTGHGGELGWAQTTSDRETGEASTLAGKSSIEVADGVVGIAKSIGSTRTQADGSSESRNAAVGATSDGQIRAGVGGQRAGAGGEDTRGFGLNGMVDLDSEGRLEAAGGSLSANKGPLSVEGSLGRRHTVEAPLLDPETGRWTVAWATQTQGSAKGSAELMEEASVGASLAATSLGGGQRSFATEAEAQAFRAAPDQLELPTTLDALVQMSEGDAISDGLSMSGGLQGSAPLVAVSAGLEGESSAGSSLQVVRGPGSTVQLTVTHDQAREGSASLGAAGSSLGASMGERERETEVFEIDLSQPGAELAWLQAISGDPVALDLPAVRPLLREQEEVQTRGAQVGLHSPSILGHQLSATWSEQREISNRQVDVAGRHTQVETGRQAFSGVAPLLGGVSEGSQLEVVTVDGEVTGFSTRASVRADGATDANIALARASGEGSQWGSASLAEQDSGRAWAVDRVYTSEQLGGFLDKARAGELTTGELSIRGGDADLQEALAGAGGDPAAEREALARFVAEHGDDALAAIAKEAGPAEPFLALEGSALFTGAEGHARLQSDLARWEAGALEGSDPVGSYAQVHDALALQQEKALVLEDGDQYQELPPALRAQERARAEGMRSRLEALDAQLLARAREEQGIDPAAAAEVDARGIAAREAVGAARARALAQQAELLGVDAVHSGAAKRQGHLVAREELGWQGWLGGLIGGGVEKEAYSRADAQHALGAAQARQAEALEAEANRLRPMSSAEQDRMDALLAEAAGLWADSSRSYDLGELELNEVEARHQSEPGYWKSPTSANS